MLRLKSHIMKKMQSKCKERYVKQSFYFGVANFKMLGKCWIYPHQTQGRFYRPPVLPKLVIWGPTTQGKVIWLCIEFLLPTTKLRYQDGSHGKFSINSNCQRDICTILDIVRFNAIPFITGYGQRYIQREKRYRRKMEWYQD